MNQKNVFTVLAILGFGFWMVSEIIEMIQGYNPAVYYMTSLYHFFAGFGIWGLYQKQTQTPNTFNRVSALIASITYLALTFSPIQVMNSGLSIADFMQQNPGYKLLGGIWFVGMFLFGVSVIKTGYFPKWSGLVMLLGVLVFTTGHQFGFPMIVVNVSNIVFSVTVIYISGQELPAGLFTPARRRRRTGEQPNYRQ